VVIADPRHDHGFFEPFKGVAFMMFRSPETGGFEFVKIAALRAAQLMRGCTPRVPPSHKSTTTAQHEVAAGKVIALPRVNGSHPAPKAA
jgi:hypothetical protein